MGQDVDQRIASMRETGQAQWSGQKLRRRKPVAKLRRVAQLPPAIVSKLHAEVRNAVAAPDTREKFSAMALDTVVNTPAEFKSMVESEIQRWGRVVKQAGITPE